MIGWRGRPLLPAGLLAAFLLQGLPDGYAAIEYLDNTPPLFDRLTPEVMAAVFPGAERLELVEDQGPPTVAAYQGDTVVGYIFSTLDVVRPRGYSSTPFDVIAGVDVDGNITGAISVFHREPHILNDSRRTELLVQYMDAMTGVEAVAPGGPPPNFISGATVSARAMRSAIRDSARIVLSGRVVPVVTEPTVDVANFRPMTPDALLADGSIASITVTNADLAAAMEQAGAADMTPQVEPRGGPQSVYLELRAGLATPAMIGRNGAGAGIYERFLADNPPGTHGILLASTGRYDLRGPDLQGQSGDQRLDRVRIIQGDRTFEFDRAHYMFTGRLLGHVSGLAILPPESGFDGLSPWRAEVLVHAAGADGRTATVVLPPLDYQLPAQHILLPEPPPVPAWVEAWREGRANAVVLGAALVLLTLILAFQSVLTRYRRAHRWVRNGFLLFTLVWLGWTVGGQLSIVHVVNYLRAPFQDFDVGFYLAEPLIVMISLYVGASLILLGRGVFCGWLCPFGALQELLAQVARFIRLPQWNPSARLQETLWLGKYAALAIVLGLVFLVPAAAPMAEEVEPFKTAINSVFARDWPFVLYAVAILSVGLFTERAFCRFLCPLGGALALIDRLHLLNVLKRRPECGSPCHLCERSCPVRAIEISGKIKTAECFHCLDCQVEYHDDERCPPLVRARRLSQGVPQPVVVPVPAVAPGAADS